MFNAQSDWWQSLYDDVLADIFLERHDRVECDATVEFLTSELNIQPGSTVFDQCCGIGSLSVPLALRGATTTGIDIIEPYIRRARESAQVANATCRFECADAFEYSTPEPCDAAFNWWTSFGYSPDDNRNLAMFQRAFQSLKLGGRFALDFQNVPMLMKDFKPSMIRRHASDHGEIVLLRESELNLQAGMIEQQWTFLFPDGRRSVRRSSVRLYMPHVLGQMLDTCGFQNVRFFGGVRNEPLRPDSPRCICIATKGA